MDTTNENTCAGHALESWLEQLKRAIRTQADFVIAEITNDPQRLCVAREVVCFFENEFRTVGAIEERCSSHGWNSQVYEAWSWARANSVRVTARHLNALEARALISYADAQDSLGTTYGEASAALREAAECLYGDDSEDDSACDDHEDECPILEF